MNLPFFPLTEPRELGDVITSDESPYLALDGEKIKATAFYAVALQRSIEDAADMLEPALPPEARPYVAVFERYLLHRAEHYMSDWMAPKWVEFDHDDGT